MFDGRFITNLLVTTFAPVCEAEETTPYDEEMAALIARGGHPHSDYMPPLMREKFNHTMPFEQQMLPIVFVFVVAAIGMCVHSCMSRQTLITSPVYNDKSGKENSNGHNAVMLQTKLH